MFTGGRLPYVDFLLAETPPRHLFHYTGPSGLLGICESKQLWAARAADVNDASEQILAFDLTQNAIKNWLGFKVPKPSPAVAQMLERMYSGIHATNRQIYVAALTAERDDLSQWRAYCPRSGGVALAFPADHLRAVAHDQGFYLGRCLYDHGSQQALINELLTHHVAVYEQASANAESSTETSLADPAVKGLAQDLAQFGPLIKHRSFSKEVEWRLVSAPSQVNDPRLIFEPISTGLRVYLPFELLTGAHPAFPSQPPDEGGVYGPGVVLGPNIDRGAMGIALQMVIYKYFGAGCWHGATDTPYR